MTPGQIVRVDFRYPLAGTGEVNKFRPAVIVGAPPVFGGTLPFEIVVPLTSAESLAFSGASLPVPPTPQNGALALSFAISWNVQAVPHARIRETTSRVTDEQLAQIRRQVAACTGLGPAEADRFI
jgi:mRNA-degrading endonuclease toxin of MazEF toxin-antitoxin module